MMSLFPITYLVSTIDSGIHFEKMSETYITVNDTNGTLTTTRAPPIVFSRFQIAMMIQLTVVNLLEILKELGQMYQQRGEYFRDFTNVTEWTLYVTSVLFAVPFLTGYPLHWQFEVGAVAVFLGWFNLLVFLQKFDLAGIYVVMFMQILKTLIQVLLVFSFLLVAFSLAFTVLMKNEADQAFSNPIIAMMRVITMLLGEIGYVE
uniref:Ion transport domain-containing protein n=2 Tax=Ciona intestinalis TaxID=7719 RepID=F7ABJ7_CIOIN